MNNKRHGYGIMVWSHDKSDKVRYEGYYQNDVRHGHGVMEYRDGSRYVGEWANNQRNGEGVMEDREGKVLYKGMWFNG